MENAKTDHKDDKRIKRFLVFTMELQRKGNPKHAVKFCFWTDFYSPTLSFLKSVSQWVTKCEICVLACVDKSSDSKTVSIIGALV